jgi:transposase InsO family protein
MKYSNDIIEKAVDRLQSKEVSQRELDRVLQIPRKTLARWLKRKLFNQPARFKRAAKKVWNKTVRPVLDKLKALLKTGKSSAIVWLKLGKICLRTVQRYKIAWFSPEPKARVKARRYERRKVFSLMHSDWGTKRIKQGVRCCFSFYEDDASRKLYALKAYSKADQTNTLHNLKLAVRQTGGFRAVLTDCGGVYRKTYDESMNGIKHIRTRPYNPKCNGKAENIVKKVKQFLSQFVVRDLAHANRLLKRFQREYNRTPHSSLKYRTPNQKYKDKQKNGAICVVT